jgi:hypothetical protein
MIMGIVVSRSLVTQSRTIVGNWRTGIGAPKAHDMSQYNKEVLPYKNIVQQTNYSMATIHTCGNSNILLHRFKYLVAINKYVLQWF